jgi:hypothetical protein
MCDRDSGTTVDATRFDKPAETLTPIANLGWSLWLAATGIALLVKSDCEHR